MPTALPTLDRSTGYPMTPRSVPLARMYTRRRLTFWQWPGDIVVRQLALELDWFLRPDLGKTVRARMVPDGRRAELRAWAGVAATWALRSGTDG
ncbi:hypothetical protein ACFRAO_27430 [Streptomyces sp. NPDC056656]|uniref:hypothetical protein n=1 Tax=Streptomyces sp. NPDC056656 TaxID=3345895 RepID=UPI0036CDED86